MIGHKLFARVKALRLFAGLDEFGDGFDPFRRHEQRILLRGGADDALLDHLDSGATAVDCDDQHALLLARRLERTIASVRGGLVDRIHEVDLGSLLENVLHRLTAGWFGVRSSVAILAVEALSPSDAFAHWPINRPALKLSVAKLASAAVIGSSGVSRVITSTPALRAFSTVGTIAVESLGTSRMPLAPAFTNASIAATWPSLSPSYLPA